MAAASVEPRKRRCANPAGNYQVNQTGSQIVSTNMMDATIEIRRQTEVIGHIADTIQVGCQPGECDQNAIAPGKIDRVRARPTDQKMGSRSHGPREAGASRRSCQTGAGARIEFVLW